MANENAKIDSNNKPTLTAVTDDANQYITRLLVDPATGRLLVSSIGNAYTLPIATASVLGGIKVGTGLSIDAGTGVLTATGGAGTVTTVSVVTANGISGTVATATTTPAITLTLGAITPTSVNGLTITANGTNTLNITAGKTLTVQDNVTITGALGTGAYATIENYLPLAGGTVTGATTFSSTANPGVTVGNGTTGYIQIGDTTISKANGSLWSIGGINAGTGNAGVVSLSFGTINTGLFGTSTSVRFSIGGTEVMSLVSGSLSLGVTTPNANAILDLTSTTKAFMPPRMTTTQKAAISTPTAGMVVYDATLGKLCVYGNGGTWQTVTSV
jgi:hypothetical protein